MRYLIFFLHLLFKYEFKAHEAIFKYHEYQYFSSPCMLLNDYKEERIRLLCFLYKQATVPYIFLYVSIGIYLYMYIYLYIHISFYTIFCK